MYLGEIVPILKKPLTVREHSPDMVCCRTLKLWADWLTEVAQNTHKWGCWIQNVIGQVRVFAHILKGEVKNPDGTTRCLYKEEWEAFKIQLDSDITEFRRYNAHVKELSDRMIEQFMGKDVACCPACLESNLILSMEQTHSVISTLADAINTSEYWRTWLDNLVEQARKLTLLPLGKNTHNIHNKLQIILCFI